MENPFRKATQKFFDRPSIAEVLGVEISEHQQALINAKAGYQDRVKDIAKRRQELADQRAEGRQEELRAAGRVIEPEGNGDRAGRRAYARRQEKQVRKGQRAYRETIKQRRVNRFTAGNMARAAAGEFGPELQRNVQTVLDKAKAEL